jgi:hypothetical protein
MVDFNFEDVPGQVARFARDSVYFTVGLVVVTAQKLKEQADDLRKQFEDSLAAGRDQWSSLTARVEPQIKAFDERYTAFEDRVGELVDTYGARLPDPAEKLLDQAFENAKSARAQVRDFWLGETAKAA